MELAFSDSEARSRMGHYKRKGGATSGSTITIISTPKKLFPRSYILTLDNLEREEPRWDLDPGDASARRGVGGGTLLLIILPFKHSRTIRLLGVEDCVY